MPQSLDTNVLVRYLAQDDARQSAAATAFIHESDADESLFIPLPVVVELEWVLRSHYAVKKAAFTELLSKLLETRQFKFHEEASVERALHLYRRSRADFADCLHLACAHTAAALPMISFDKAAARLEGVELLAS